MNSSEPFQNKTKEFFENNLSSKDDFVSIKKPCQKNNLLKVKILLFNLKSTNREFNDIIASLDKLNSTDDIFNRIFSINTFNNLEMYEYLSIFSYTTTNSTLLITKLINLKFYPDKDTDLVILKYFNILNNLIIEDTDTLFARYILLLNSTMFNRTTNQLIFDQFVVFLKKYPKYESQTNLLTNSNYKYKLNVDTTNVNLIFSQPSLLHVLINNTLSKYLIQEYLKNIPNWLLKSLSNNIVVDLYSNFDCNELYRPVCYIWFKGLSVKEQLFLISEIYGSETGVFDSKNSENFKCQFKSSIEISDEGSIRKLCDNNLMNDFNFLCDNFKLNFSYKFANLNNDIALFNKTKDITPLYFKYNKYTFYILRFHHMTNLRSLGEFLCNHRNIKYLKEFTETFDFNDMNLLEAMRSYLDSFHLVGETQNIHRILEIFSKRYCFNVFCDVSSNGELNEDILEEILSQKEYKELKNIKSNINEDKIKTNNDKSKNEKNEVYLNYDITFQITFSLLLLNTKMHNPNIKTKPSFEEYMIDFKDENMGPYDNTYMMEMYSSIKNNKLSVPTVNKPCKIHYDVYTHITENDKFITSDKKWDIEAKKNILSFNKKIDLNFVNCQNSEELANCSNEHLNEVTSEQKKILNSIDYIEHDNSENITNIRNTPSDSSLNTTLIFVKYIYTYLVDTLIYETPSFLDIPFDKFLIICKNINLHYTKIYLIYNRDNFYRFLSMFNFYLQQPGELRLYKLFVNVLSKISSKKSSGIYQIQNQYRQSYNKIISNGDLNPDNIQLIDTLIKSNVNEHIIKTLVYMLKSNIKKVTDISYLSTNQKQILYEDGICPLSLLNKCDDRFNVLLTLLETEQIQITEHLLNFISNHIIFNEESFFVLIFVRLFLLKNWLNTEIVEVKKNFENLVIKPKDDGTNEKVENIILEKIENDKLEKNMNNLLKGDVANQKIEDFESEKCENDKIQKIKLDIKKNFKSEKNEDDESEIINESTNAVNELKICESVNANNLKKFAVLEDDFIKTNYKLETWKKLNLFYTSSFDIYNDKILKKIIKNSCLRTCSISSNIPSCIKYMLEKCDEINIKENINFTLWIINLISSSLIVLINVLKETKEHFNNDIKRILISRLKKYSEGAHLCCDCGYSDCTIVEEYLKNSIAEKKISKNEIEFFRFCEV